MPRESKSSATPPSARPATASVDDVPADILTKLQFYDGIYSTAMTARGQTVYPPPFNAPSFPPAVKAWAFTRSTSHIALIETPELVNPSYRTKRTQAGPKHAEAGIAYTKAGKMVMALSSNAAWSFDPDRSASLDATSLITVGANSQVINRVDNRTIHYYDPNAQQLMVPITTLLWTLGRGFTPYLDEIVSVKRENDDVLVIEGPGFCDMQRIKGRWTLKVESKSQYLIRSARFFLESAPTQTYIELSNQNIKINGGCIYPTSGQWEFPPLGLGARHFTFSEVILAAENSIFTKARQITDDVLSPRTTVLDYRVAPPKLTHVVMTESAGVDEKGMVAGQILKDQQAADRPMAIPSRKRDGN
jgi:hypothetical protein